LRDGNTMNDGWTVAEAVRLIPFLRAKLPEWKRSTLEQRVHSGCVEVDGVPVQRNDLLKPGATVRIVERPQARLNVRIAGRIPVLYQDDWLVAIDKPAGLLSVSTDSEREKTALALVRDGLGGGGLWPVHRLDRETSGVLLFARTKETQAWVQDAWEEAQKQYLAVVEGRPKADRGVVEAPLFEDPILGVQVGDGPGAKDARTRYAVRSVHRNRTLLDVELDTGRRHQIRVHLAWLGCPVVGDLRYGTRARRMGLHAARLSVLHPGTARPVVFDAPPPQDFTDLMR